jgi:hypothetical protein
MTTGYDDAVVALYQSPPDKFVAERKRLAAELRAGGDRAGATRLAHLNRPTIAAWAVNQLWWHEHETFDALFAAAERLRSGELAATGARRDAMAKLRARAALLLETLGHAAAEATLRRVTTNLSALAAAGSFDPDPPGALTGDRDPLGFDIAGIAVSESDPRTSESEGSSKAKAKVADLDEQRRRDEEERRRIEEQRRVEEERAKRQAERVRLEEALRSAKGDLEERTREVDRMRKDLAGAEKWVEQARAAVADAEARLAAFERPR